MSGTQTTGSIPRFLQEGIEEVFGNSLKERDPYWSMLFDEKKSRKAFEVQAQLEGYGLAKRKPEGQSVSFDSRRQGFTPKFINYTYAKGFVVTEEALEDNLYDVALGDAKGLGRSMRVTKETVLHNILNRGFDSNYVMPDGDGLSLFSAAHINGPTNTSTYSNKLSVAAAFSEAALEDMLILIDRATDARGLPVMLEPGKLCGPSELRFEFERVIGSVLQNNTANNAINATKSLGAIREGWTTSPYLTSTTAWFLKTDAPAGLQTFTRRAMSFGEDNSFDTGNARYKASERYSAGWADPRGCFGTEGA
tara:strand:- start:357 stop:1280 length:924 start_codon:yes stop_codon:yes gene_type:complete